MEDVVDKEKNKISLTYIFLILLVFKIKLKYFNKIIYYLKLYI